MSSNLFKIFPVFSDYDSRWDTKRGSDVYTLNPLSESYLYLPESRIISIQTMRFAFSDSADEEMEGCIVTYDAGSVSLTRVTSKSLRDFLGV
jgi:hypothetical protein